ncbi:hypothetical protein BKA70DRAFT_1345038 [Coprinopsis sp. MPI-PUGE-AT-0042]|nr:hypothetical protein BKA70DRAFT_1345038 [Coprinopsis sp. MPI-PUGE-AT-0042]
MADPNAVGTDFGRASPSTHQSKDTASLSGMFVAEASNPPPTGAAGLKAKTNGASKSARRKKPPSKQDIGRYPIGSPPPPQMAGSSTRVGTHSSSRNAKVQPKGGKGGSVSSECKSPPASTPPILESGNYESNTPALQPRPESIPALRIRRSGALNNIPEAKEATGSERPEGGNVPSQDGSPQTPPPAFAQSEHHEPQATPLEPTYDDFRRSGGSDVLGNAQEANDATGTNSEIENTNPFNLDGNFDAALPSRDSTQEAAADNPPAVPSEAQPPMFSDQTSNSSPLIPSSSSESQKHSTSMSSAETGTGHSESHPPSKPSVRLEEKRESTNPSQPVKEVKDSTNVPLRNTSGFADVVEMKRILAIPHSYRKKIQSAMERRHRMHTRFTINIQRLTDPQQRKSLKVSKEYTLLELYTLVFLLFNSHPEQCCLYFKRKELDSADPAEALDLLMGNEKTLESYGIEPGSALILSNSSPGAFVQVDTAQAAESLSVKQGSMLIAHTVVSRSQIRCSDSQGRIGIVGYRGVQITQMFKHSLADEIATVSVPDPLRVGTIRAPISSEPIPLKGPCSLLCFLSCGLLGSHPSMVVNARLHVPPWSADRPNTSTLLPSTGNPHLLLKENFGQSTVVFEARSNHFELPSPPPSIKIAVKCLPHGNERVSFLTLGVSLPEKERITGISPMGDFGEVDAAMVSSHHIQSDSVGVNLGVGLDAVAKLDAQLKRTGQRHTGQVFAGRAQRKTEGVRVGDSEAVWIMNENRNGLEGLAINTDLTLEFNCKPRTVLLTYRIDVTRPDRKKPMQREGTACFLFP